MYVIVMMSIIIQGYYGCSIGKAARQARTEIEKLKLDQMSVDDAIDTAARMYVVHGDDDDDVVYSRGMMR